jgi:hypothetical protein
MITDEQAKAAQEVAKATKEGITAPRELGGFFSKIVRGPLEEASGMLQDRLRYARWERRVRLAQRAQDFLREMGVEEPTRTLPLNVAIPLIEAASLEENDELQDSWAALLANAADADSGVEVRRALITILPYFGVLEARLLNAIVNAPNEVTGGGSVPTKGLPDAYIPPEEGTVGESPPEEIEVGLWNLVRLGCIAPGMAASGLTVNSVHPTALGVELVRACTTRKTSYENSIEP